MGTLVGHVAPGFAFFALGLWHLFNHIKLHAINPSSYTSFPWFPTSKFRYSELLSIMVCSSISISMELFIGPAKHHPFDTDGTIPSNHLHNFEHSAISMTFFAYAAFAIVVDKSSNINPIAKSGLTQLLGAVAFAQQLFLFHLHSADHMGVEGQYHLLLQSAIVVFKHFVPRLMAYGHGLHALDTRVDSEGLFYPLRRGSPSGPMLERYALHRAKSLVNIGFSWTLIGVIIFAMGFYLALVKLYGEKVEYSTLAHHEAEKLELGDDDVELQKGQSKLHGEPKSFIHMGKGYGVMDMER
ncbi:hypothetical protein V6N13_079141 [Hibiscus sabdariffa]|uniref:Uncharacterized protein n=1 Tax=Hibiscus sabdariffa TaxID=183260 RepID=A0ABR2RQH9_9ROSI